MCRIATAFLVCVCLAGPAAALPPRTFVASTGSDVNTCGRPDPCRTFGVALAAVASGGEVVALDSAGYGPFTVAQPVAVIAPMGVHAAVAATSGDGVDISSAGRVILRGLYINTPGGGNIGVFVSAVGSLNVENCVINGFTEGVYDPVPSSSLIITDSTIRNIGDTGLFADAPGAPAVQVLVDHSRFEYCGFSSVNMAQGAMAVIRDTVASHGNYGFVAQSHTTFGPAGVVSLTCERCTAEFNASQGYASAGNTTGAVMTLTDSVAAENNIGIAGNAGIVHISRCSIVHNTTGVGAAVLSRGDNTFADNGTDGIVTPFSAK